MGQNFSAARQLSKLLSFRSGEIVNLNINDLLRVV